MSHHADGRALDPQPAARPSACTTVPGVHSTFPAMAVNGRGVAFAALNDGGVLRSRDGGRSWEHLNPGADAKGNTHNGAIHGQVTVDRATGRLFYVTFGNTRGCGSLVSPDGQDHVPLVRLPAYRGVFLSYSDDEGATWKHSVVACDLFDWPKVFTGPPTRTRSGYVSNVYVAASYPLPFGPLKKVYRSTDGGATFTATKKVASDSFEPGAGVVAPDGTIYMDEVYTAGAYAQALGSPYPYRLQDQGRPRVIISRDDGDSWTQVALPGRALTSVYGTQRVAVDRAGNVYAVWTDDSDNRPRLSISRDSGRTWSAPIRVQAPEVGDANFQVSVAAGLPGQVAISYPGSIERRPYPSGVYVPDYRDYHGYIARTENALDPQPTFTTARINPLDKPLAPKVRLNDAIGEALGLAIGPDGAAWAGFTRSTNDFEPGPAVSLDPTPHELVLSRLLPGAGSTTNCLASRGPATRTALGSARLGADRRAQRRSLGGYRVQSSARVDSYCMVGGGTLRVGYRGARAARGARSHRRAAVLLTSSDRVSVRGVRVGDRASSLERRRWRSRVRRRGTTWYFRRAGGTTFVARARGGRVQAVGLATRSVTGSKRARAAFARNGGTGR